MVSSILTKHACANESFSSMAATFKVLRVWPWPKGHILRPCWGFRVVEIECKWKKEQRLKF